MQAKFTVFFEEPFWVGVLEIIDDNKLKIGKVVFGHEPGDAELYEFTKNEYHKIKFDETEYENKKIKKINPKRMQRIAIKEQKKKGIATKSQEAIKKIHEDKKEERRKNKIRKKLEVKEIRYNIKKEKRKKRALKSMIEIIE